MKNMSDLMTEGRERRIHLMTIIGMLGCELIVLLWEAIINVYVFVVLKVGRRRK